MISKNDKWLDTGDMVMVQSGHVKSCSCEYSEAIMDNYSRPCFSYVQISKG